MICCTSEFAFGDPLTREGEIDLARTYRNAGIKRFHYMNAGTLALSKVEVFYSYYTELARIFYNGITHYFVLFVSPFIYDTERYRNSCTSNRQLNKWLYEKGIETDVKHIREYYARAHSSDIGIQGEIFPKICGMDPQNRACDYIPVTLRFKNEQNTLNDDGSFDYEIVNPRVPALTYNVTDEYMYKAGTFVHRGNECGLVYKRS